MEDYTDEQKALEDCRAVWAILRDEPWTCKTEAARRIRNTGFIHSCPCCEYVVRKTKSPVGASCAESCPLREEWGTEGSSLHRGKYHCEGPGSPYEDWSWRYCGSDEDYNLRSKLAGEMVKMCDRALERLAFREEIGKVKVAYEEAQETWSKGNPTPLDVEFALKDLLDKLAVALGVE